MENAKFCQIANYQYSSEAYLFKGKLESEGIEVFLQNENTINTDPLLSNALGGVKLFVQSEDVLKARHILDSIPEYSVDDTILEEYMLCERLILHYHMAHQFEHMV